MDFDAKIPDDWQDRLTPRDRELINSDEEDPKTARLSLGMRLYGALKAQDILKSDVLKLLDNYTPETAHRSIAVRIIKLGREHAILARVKKVTAKYREKAAELTCGWDPDSNPTGHAYQDVIRDLEAITGWDDNKDESNKDVCADHLD